MAADEEVIPGLQLDPSLEAKLEGLDDELKPLEGMDDPFKKGDKDGDTESESNEADDEADNGDDNNSTEEESDEGYTIDEGEEEEVKEDVKADEAVPLENLNPEQKYIIDNIQPITVRGVVGDGEIKEYKVYDPSQLPQGFKYADDREGALANKQFALLETKAEQLQNNFRNQETAKASTEFKKREDTADREDIGNLQRAGDIPKFKTSPESADFDKDPAAVLVQEVLDYKEEVNKKYYDEYQAGRPYKHIGFEEAFKLYKRSNPVNEEQDREDVERKELSRRTSNTRGSSNQTRPRVKLGSSRDIDNYIESLEF